MWTAMPSFASQDEGFHQWLGAKYATRPQVRLDASRLGSPKLRLGPWQAAVTAPASLHRIGAR